MNGIADAVAVVTGAGSGIGRASAKRFASEGARVVAADIAGDAVDETVEQIAAAGGDATAIEIDISDRDDVERMVDCAVETYGGLDFAHNNAGVLGERAETAEQSMDAWDAVQAVNLKGTWLCMRAEIPRLQEQDGGCIVNTSSGAGLVGHRELAPYSASKHGVVGLTRTAAIEYAEEGIRVNAVCPGPIDTGMSDDELSDVAVEATPMKRTGQPEEIASAVVWLCSDDASFITGHPLSVDGGRRAD